MARLTYVALLFACTATLFAQHRGGGGGAIRTGPGGGGGAVRPAPRGGYGMGNILNPGGVVNSGGTYGYGNILFPGGVSAFPNGVTMPSPGPRGGYGGGRVYGRGGRQRTLIVPYAVPIAVGGYGYGYGYDAYGYAPPVGYGMAQPATNVTVVVPQQPAPQVIVNPDYTPDTANPVMRDYSTGEIPGSSAEQGGLRIYDAPAGAAAVEPSAPAGPKQQVQHTPAPPVTAADEKPTIYLIALKDSTVRAAIGYWAEDSILNYVTPQGSINHVSLDMLDRETTEQLNRKQGLEFDLKTR